MYTIEWGEMPNIRPQHRWPVYPQPWWQRLMRWDIERSREYALRQAQALCDQMNAREAEAARIGDIAGR